MGFAPSGLDRTFHDTLQKTVCPRRGLVGGLVVVSARPRARRRRHARDACKRAEPAVQPPDHPEGKKKTSSSAHPLCELQGVVTRRDLTKVKSGLAQPVVSTTERTLTAERQDTEQKPKPFVSHRRQTPAAGQGFRSSASRTAKARSSGSGS